MVPPVPKILILGLGGATLSKEDVEFERYLMANWACSTSFGSPWKSTSKSGSSLLIGFILDFSLENLVVFSMVLVILEVLYG